MREIATTVCYRFFRMRLIRYGAIGLIATAIHFGIAFGLIYAIQATVWMANVVGFLVAFLFSYLMQSRHVFEADFNFLHVGRYFIVQIGSLFVSIGFSTLFVDLNRYVKTVIVIVCMPLITYFIHKVWTFR